ncbi:tandem-95 repeat protein (plasmid) [Nostoc sp. C057]|uniref:FG-GAP-like repeat-containing protein n=1 Tax=Nostoc sp. C057 TaxID=2576903 RepID=UPI0015C33896|nr:FG-GAP-like repeat-containing protein [Nostoc sp. C057]QLE53574.1 tandem-95 repeat protein [Nostoc sp. C057]
MTTFNQQTGTANPFNGISVGIYSHPTFADIDGDGDLDAIVGAVNGTLRYYQNTGTATNPIYTEQTGTANPFNGISVGNYSTPTLADIDGDGDLDAIVGAVNGTLRYYQNTGTATNPTYTEQTGTANPFNGISVGNFSSPTLADIDGDGDLDAIVGAVNGTLRYYKNTGTATNPTYTEQTGTANPFNGISVGSISSPTFGDIDGDGDLDAIVGKGYGTLFYYKNTGTATNPTYTEQTGTANPFNGVDVGNFSSPTLADIDADGDLDAIVGANDGTLRYFQNNTPPEPFAFVAATGTANPFNGIDVGFSSTPTLADIDGDGDLDVLIGESDGTLNYYKNTGTATNPTYTQQTGTANPFNGIVRFRAYQSSPTFADIDGDGDLDAIVGEQAGILKYYKNTGTATNPTYTQQTGTANPFNAINVGGLSNATLADIDGDGDLDAIVGATDGILKYYKNTGTATNPTYTEQTGTANPFNGIDVGSISSPTLADIDGDGDLDVLIGESDGILKYYKNTGTATNPTYTEQTGTANPFNGVDVGTNSSPTFADIDGDGDLDAIVGANDGTLKYYENVLSNLPPVAVNDAVSTNENTVLNGNLLAANPTTPDSDPDGNPLTVTQVNGIATNVGSEIDLGNGKLTVNTDGTFSFNPNGGYESLAQGATTTESFTYTISDGSDGTASATATITINGVNDVATITGTATAAVTEDATTPNLTATGSLTVTDVDTNESLFNTTVTSATGNLGSLSITNAGAYSYSVANSAVQFLGAGQTKAETFTVNSVDGTASQDITVTINGVNDAPTGSPTATLSNTPEDTAITITAANLLAGFSDVDTSDTLSVTNLTATNGALVNNNNGTYTFTPTANFNGAVNLSYGVTDGTATLTGQSRSFTVTPVNDAPVGVNDSVITAFNTAVSIQTSTLLANDTDIDSTGLSITAVSGVTHGTVVLNNNGTASNTADDFVLFAPTTGFSGNAIFNYTLSDGSLTSTASVTVAIGADINGTNQADNLVGTNGNDNIEGGNGNDTIYGGAGNDTIEGGNGNDLLYGDGFMNGGVGNDYLEGGNGNDTLYGGAGIDTLTGGNGNDLLYGGAGSDILTGDNGNDIFAFAAGEGTDTITDFTQNNDLIGLYNGLSFGQLSFSSSNILVTSTNEILATLTGTNTTTLTAANFVTL